MSIKGFMLRALVWLPICFAVWYYSSILFVAPLARALDLLSRALLPQLVSAVETYGNEIQVVLTLQVQGTSTGLLRTGDMLFEIDPLIYGFSVPLYTVLVLASRAPDGRRLGAWLIGMIILFAVQILCIQADILKVVAIDLAGQTRPLLGLPSWGLEAIVIGYQLGFLILPGVTPIALWLVQFRDLVMDMASGREAAHA